MDTIQGRVETGLLNPLFEARLQYQSDMEAVVSAETREGELVGSGDGRVSGDVLSGNARWSMYAGNCAYVFVRAGLLPPPGQHLCTVHPAGVIATDDGAQIWFDAKGYGLRGADQGQPHLWVLTMAVQFTTTDQRYQWLNTTLGVVRSGALLSHRRRQTDKTVHLRKVYLCYYDDSGCVGVGVLLWHS